MAAENGSVSLDWNEKPPHAEIEPAVQARSMSSSQAIAAAKCQ
jgi:hypothetical protein